MNKNTKMILGVGAIAIVGYLVWKQMSSPKAGFANLTASLSNQLGCPCKNPPTETVTTSTGTILYHCPGGQYCEKTSVPKSFVGR
jgi:hypothetical protein